MRNKWAKANSLGSSIDDNDFKSILLTSLPSSWTPIIAIYLKDSTSTKTISLLKTWLLHFSQNKSSNLVTALQVSRPPRRDWDQLLCVNSNCNCWGHTIKTCYWPGGRKERQFPPEFGKCGGTRGTALNTHRGEFCPQTSSTNIATAPVDNNKLVFVCVISIGQNHEVLTFLSPDTTHISNNTPISSDNNTKDYVHRLSEVCIGRR